MLTINDYFTSESAVDGEITMLSRPSEDSNKAFYLINTHGDKLLKILVGSEPAKHGEEKHAQIKIAGYGIKFIKVWADKVSDPQRIRLSENLELTYHGVRAADKNPKIHLKAKSGYHTLIDDALLLPVSTKIPVPIFAYESGYKNLQYTNNPATKKAHKLSTSTNGPVRFDFYMASADADLSDFVNSMYFFNLLFTQDYLADAMHRPLVANKIIAPIKIFQMGGYILLARRSVSIYTGQPFLALYSNKKYYEKMMNRSTAWKDSMGVTHWSTLEQDEVGLQARLRGKAN
jgi:hypothetical protein